MVMHAFDNRDLSQEIFAIDTLAAVICSLGHGRKHMLAILPTTWRPRLSRWIYIRNVRVGRFFNVYLYDTLLEILFVMLNTT